MISQRASAITRVAALLLLLGGAVSHAATPAAGTVSESQPSATWEGSLMPPIGAVGCSTPNDSSCDNFRLTITPPSHPFTVQITLHVNNADDWDLKVYNPAGQVIGTSGNNPGNDEIVTLTDPAAGTYTVQAVNFAGTSATFGVASLAPRGQDAASPGPGPAPTYSLFADPNGHSSGEPSCGVSWKSEIADNGGTVMYISSLTTLRLRFNDCTSPARLRPGDDWRDVSPPNAVTSLDPILFTDSMTGRTFSSQLLGTTSLMSYSDDDGDSWVPSQGGGIASGVDHQTVGGGPFAAPLFGPVYSHAVYYCSQDIGLAQCALSVDGGLTFGPAVPIYNLTECTGIHGHVKVGPDGAAYVPNKACGGRQAVVVSSNNGTTWTVRPVPGSLAGSWDPAVAVGAKGTLYFAFGNGDGRAMVTVSHDQGVSWSQPVDIGAAFGVRDTAFPAAIAGDDDRAAIAFLGTSTPSSSGDDPASPAVWYLYVAHTYDGGAHWTTVNATPGDPVQRGTICAGGTLGCDNGSRNLLDFIDIQVDRRGRTVVPFADGCVGPCVDSPNVNTQGALATVARMKGGTGLFSAFDKPLGPPDEPLTSAQFESNGVRVSWLEPADGGRPIKKYRVYRVQTGQSEKLIGTVDATTFSFVDRGFNPAKNPRYEVRAVNVYGESQAKSGCDNRVTPAGPPPPVNVCAEPGAIIVTDPQGDATGANPAHDVQQISVAEPADPGPGKVTFILKVASLAAPTPSTTWPINFKGADGKDYWVAMKASVTGAISFAYGTGTNASAAGTPADPASNFSADGTIRIVVPRSAFGNPAPGATISSFLTRVRVELGPTGSALTPDNAPDGLTGSGNYRLIGSENCGNGE
jgi:fibronectin type III domain protein